MFLQPPAAHSPLQRWLLAARSGKGVPQPALGEPFKEPRSWGELKVAGRLIARRGGDSNCTRRPPAGPTSRTEVRVTYGQRNACFNSRTPGINQQAEHLFSLVPVPIISPHPPISLYSRETASKAHPQPVTGTRPPQDLSSNIAN